MFNIIFSYVFFGLTGRQLIIRFTYTPLQAVIPTESLETTTRAKGLAGSGIIVSAFGFINSFAGPYALGNIGYVFLPRSPAVPDDLDTDTFTCLLDGMSSSRVYGIYSGKSR